MRIMRHVVCHGREALSAAMQDDPEEAAETCIDWLKMHGAAVVQTPGRSVLLMCSSRLDCCVGEASLCRHAC